MRLSIGTFSPHSRTWRKGVVCRSMRSATRSRTSVRRTMRAPSDAIFRWSSGAASTVAPSGIGDLSPTWPRSWSRAAYSRSWTFLGVHAHGPRDAHRAGCDARGMPRRGVAGHLGEPGQGGDRLAVGRAVRRVAAHRDVGQHHRQQPSGSAARPDDGSEESHQGTGRQHPEGERLRFAELLATARSPRGATAAGHAPDR